MTHPSSGGHRGSRRHQATFTWAVAVIAIPLSGCATLPAHRTLATPAPVFSPNAFFDGETDGIGTLAISMMHARKVHVTGQGHTEADGTLVLVQRIADGHGSERTRTWRIRPIGGDRFTGTLTDAVGPVEADVHGNRLHIRYAAKAGLRIEQWLYLQPGGRVALNRMAVRKFGLPIASLSETITRR